MGAGSSRGSLSGSDLSARQGQDPTGAADRLAAAAAAWRDADPDPVTRAELDQLLASGDTEALSARFEGSLAFGTAGIRAEIGAGPMRMNRLVIGRVATGLARYVKTRDPAAVTAGVVVGYDGRTNSAVFAADAARILSRAGISVSMLPRALPTPVLAFSVRYLHAAYGLMVTASHNPRQYNGLKVYVRDGGQLLPPVDADMASAIDAVDPLQLPKGWAEGSFAFRPADQAADAYVAAVASRGHPPAGSLRLKVVHTALHGVGDATLRNVLARAGWPMPVPVAAQQQPDPAFPTAHYPNPEEPGVLDLAQATAEQVGADLVLANDPDADRVAVMVPGPGGWQTLTGDELGALLGDAVLTRLGQGDPIEDPGGLSPVVATTVVSGSLLRRLAQSAGVRCVTTLTGFKWIARAGGADAALIYGYEQALGYAVRPHLVADKDGISAALLVLQLATAEAQQGRSLLDRLDDLAMAHGLHLTRQRALRADGEAGLSQLDEALERVRKCPPRLLAGQPVTVTDLREAVPGVVDLAGGHAEQSPGRPLPPADVLIWHAGSDARVMIRPSGTEPELKIYAEVVQPVPARAELGAARAVAAQRVEQMLSDAAAALGVASPADGSAPSNAKARHD
jgi:phosphomannomutase